MYSRGKAVRGTEIIPPVGYRGNCFSRGLPEEGENENEYSETAEIKDKRKSIMQLPFIKSMGKEELLIIGLVLILFGENGLAEGDTVLILLLLLCID